MVDNKNAYEYSKELSVLYVEDDIELNEETFDIFSDLFKVSQSTLNGQEGLEEYNKFHNETGKYYDIVITDIQMPKLNGIELIKKIQELNKDQEIIVISAYSDADKLMSLIEHGISDFLLKPISYKKLIEVIYKVCIIIDNKKAQENFLFQQSKNAALGSMVGNIIHQWKQPLNYISLISATLQMDAELEGKVEIKRLTKDMQDIDKSIQRLTTTTETFRSFLKAKKEFKEVVLQDTIKEALVISGTILQDKHIELINEIEKCESITLYTNPNELIEVIINIVNNAIDILEEKEITKPFVKLELVKDNGLMIISIEDNAGGIPEDIVPNIFDEYFTTKSDDKGTGLGLYMSKKIVCESLNGDLEVSNTLNGAKFFIKIPLL
ncbi:response regulator [Sulfurospirillum arcachonense]|uniref:response regulator n=1 Tax=Sulfurospirillum arcachonense TaxID=57666 RepID=UPI00046950A6|nr:response regulator [Sulfurospirillum arcachonense]